MNWLQTLLRQSRNGRKFNLSQEIVRTRLREIQLGWEGWSKARRAKVSTWIGFWERTMGELEWLWWEGGWWDGGRTVGEFVQQAQHVARHSGLSGTPHLLCTSKILLSTTTLLAIHIYQPHSQFYMNFTLQCRLYIERACYLRQPQSAS